MILNKEKGKKLLQQQWEKRCSLVGQQTYIFQKLQDPQINAQRIIIKEFKVLIVPQSRLKHELTLPVFLGYG